VATDEDGVEEQKTPTSISFEQRFGWYAILNRIADDDITKHRTVTEKSLVAALNQLTFILAKEKEIIKRTKEAQTNGGMAI
jgi:hypothetical protein